MAQIIAGSHLFDGKGGVIRNGAVRVDGERIVACGPFDQMERTPDTEIIQVENGFVMPGFVDAHNHLGLSHGDDEQQMGEPIELILDRMRNNARKNIESGVTTLRELGERDYLDLQLRREIEERQIPGPRLVTAGPWITASHGHGSYLGGDIADGIDEVRKAVRKHIKRGVDVIKLMISGGMGTRGSVPYHCYYTSDELKVAVAEAHNVGKPVAVHVHGGPGVRIAVEAGIDTLEHGSLITDPWEIEMIVNRGVFWVFTNGLVLQEPNETLPDFVVENYKRAHERVQVAFASAYAAGAKICLGADSVHGDFAWELECAVRCGASIVDALTAATSVGAEACGLADQVGALAPGMLADVLVLEGNPLDDIASLRNVALVMKSGRIEVNSMKEVQR